ncbi:MAG TPA: ribbon-helix-helix domain-containing protein [Sphingomicrobium sp.]|nr:ribbon-helix-helix domain-containing protein [Sphingomicrobium sp.]
MAGQQPPGPPVKRSVTIAGHETSIALEPIFWTALEAAADEERLPLNALIARIDAERLQHSPPANLASAIRQLLFARASAREQDPGLAGDLRKH